MKFYNNATKYPLALTAGVIIGWSIQPWSDAPNQGINTTGSVTAAPAKSPKGESNSNNLEVAINEPSLAEKIRDEKPPSLKLNGQLQQANDMHEWSAAELISHIGSMEENDFWNQINSGEIRSALEKSPRLFDEFMSSVLDQQDKMVSRRLLYLFENMNGYYNSGETAVRYPVEKWIMQRVNSENRTTEWLSFLGKLGVQSKESYMSLASRLRDYTEPSQTTAILSILARRPYFQGHTLNNDEIDLVNQVIEPHYRSDNHVDRMFAVASLSNMPFEQSESKLLAAMSDESIRVRMSAMRVIRDNSFNSPEFSKSLIASLADTTLSAYERLGAYEVLSRTKLNQEQYKAVYSFAENERVALKKEFHALRQASQNSNQ